MNDQKPNIEEMSFEQALAELETIVKNLESGNTALEDSIESYERGILLKNHCEKKLRAAQEKIEKISIKEDGTATTAPFATQETA